jgi:glutathione synthase/RimK-type ligase-like ATP-grasp enzyme
MPSAMVSERKQKNFKLGLMFVNDMPGLRIGIITCPAEKLRDYFPTVAEPDLLPTEPPFTPDDQLLVDELRRRGHSVQPVIWGGDVAELRDSFDRLLIRSPWDYMDSEENRLAFMKWIDDLDHSGIVVDNPPAVLSWLTHKRYLLDLEQAGVPIVPTQFVAAGNDVDLASCFAGPLVIKPAISAAGAGLESFQNQTEIKSFQAEFSRLIQRQDYLIQPLLSEIQSKGEWSLVYFGGTFSHAIHKVPAHGKILCHAEQGGSLRFVSPPTDVRQAADQAMQLLPQAFRAGNTRVSQHWFSLLYLRVDLIETVNGPLVSECEGVEPELFFRARSGSEKDFADVVEGKR